MLPLEKDMILKLRLQFSLAIVFIITIQSSTLVMMDQSEKAVPSDKLRKGIRPTSSISRQSLNRVAPLALSIPYSKANRSISNQASHRSEPDDQEPRPFYIIGHMANNIDSVNKFLRLGANSVESDISFSKTGQVDKIYHGFPCDPGRYCWSTTDPVRFLEHLRSLSEYGHQLYHENFSLVMLDLKLPGLSSNAKMWAGRDLANKLSQTIFREVIDVKVKNYQPLNVLLSLQIASDIAFVTGFKKFFFDTHGSQAERLYNRYIGWDDSSNGKISSITEMWQRSGAGENIWQGNGITNAISWIPKYLQDRLQGVLNERDSYGKIHKVYSWTFDNDYQIRNAIKMGVDGIITNYADVSSRALSEMMPFGHARFATREDNPWKRIARQANCHARMAIPIIKSKNKGSVTNRVTDIKVKNSAFSKKGSSMSQVAVKKTSSSKPNSQVTEMFHVKKGSNSKPKIKAQL